jgi:hypothetical protein
VASRPKSLQTSNSSANWYAPLSNAFSDVSKKYTALDVKEQDREETRLLREKEQSRFDLTRGDRLAQDKVNNNIAKENLGFKKDEADYTNAGRKAKREVSEFTNNPENANRKFILEQYAPEQQDEFNKATNGLNQERDVTKNFLTNAANGILDDKDFEQAYRIYESRVLSNVENKTEANSLINERGLRLSSLQKELVSITDPEKKNSLIKTAIDGLYNPQYKRIQDAIDSGQALTKREKNNAYASMFSPETRARLTNDEIGELIGSMNTAVSRETLSANEFARVAAANQASKDNIAGVKSFFSALGSNDSSKAYNRTSKGISLAMKDIAALNIGKFDDEKAKEALTNMLENEDIDPQIAASIIALNVKKGLFDDTIEGVGTKDFNDMKAMALDLSTPKGYSGKGKRPVPTLDQFQYQAVSPRGITDLMRSRVNGNSLNDFSQRLTINSEFDVRRPRVNTQQPSQESTTVVDRNILFPRTGAPRPIDNNAGIGSNFPLDGITSDPEKSQRIEAYRESTGIANEVNKRFGGSVGGSGVEGETLLVLPFDEKGNAKPWNVVWDEINANSNIKFGDTISEEEGNAAANDPKKQKELIDKSNLLIGENLKFMAAGGGIMQDIRENTRYALTSAMDATSDFFTGYSPSADNERKKGRNEVYNEYRENDELRSRLSDFVNNRLGNDVTGEGNYEQLANSTGTLISNSPTIATGAGTVAAAGIALSPAVALAVKNGPRAVSVIKNAKDSLSLLLRRPIKVPKGVNTTAKDRTGAITREQAFSRKMEVPTATRLQQQMYQEALRRQSLVNAPRG